MELKFLGRGAAFNPKEGNNSAYFIDNEKLFLIDCGESVFEALITAGILDHVSDIELLITHTHSDHIGSLGTLAMYSYFVKNKPINIVLGNATENFSEIAGVLKAFGVTDDMVRLPSETSFDNRMTQFEQVRYVPTGHIEELNSYGLLFSTENGIVYYSGDTNDITPILSIIESGQLIDKIFVDSTNVDYPGNVHLSLKILDENIPQELRKKVFCMHVNNDQCIEQAKELGFQVVSTVRQEMFQSSIEGNQR